MDNTLVKFVLQNGKIVTFVMTGIRFYGFLSKELFSYRLMLRISISIPAKAFLIFSSVIEFGTANAKN